MTDSLTGSINNEAAAIHKAFDATSITFHDRTAALATFKEGREIVFEDGQPFALYDREFLPLSDALKRFGYDRREMVDGRTLPRQGAGTSRPGIDSKANYLTTKDKVDYINTHGADAWERLPLKGPSSREVVTHQDWYALPRAERVRLTNVDPDFFAKLKPSPGLPQPGQAKVYLALEKHKASRPGYKAK